mmetsp:Transcript_13695/g.20449  ORF Transcript_13695/g.20449 Transcript_13695/m.20449 type:complete len:763 (-) Transcript_13695:176-2464(-)
MSGGKPEFDPRIHLLNPRDERCNRENQSQQRPPSMPPSLDGRGNSSLPNHDDDEALARKLQEEMDQADHERLSWENRAAQDDMELARRMQKQELRSRTEPLLQPSRKKQENGLNSRQHNIHDEDAALALRLMEEENTRSRVRVHSHDNDLELARRMQTLEHQGLGRLNSERDGMQEAESELRMAGKSKQEQEDEMLARDLHLAETSSELLTRGNNLGSGQSLPRPSTPSQSTAPSMPSQSTAPPTRERRPMRRTSAPSNYFRDREHPSILFPFPTADPLPPNASVRLNPATQPPKERKKKKLFGLGPLLRGRSNDRDKDTVARSIPVPPSIPLPTRTPGPLPNSVSVDRPLPIAATPQQQCVETKPKKSKTLKNRPAPSTNVPNCAVCKKPALRHLFTLGKRYHPECFKCVGCHQVIEPSSPFAFSTDEATGDKHPLHRKCYATLYGVKCAVCQESIPTGPDGRMSYVKHPFFEKEQMCPRHALNPGRRCTGCHRFEPITGTGFADLGDANRCVCLSCCRTVIVDSEDAKKLWERVIRFLGETLNLPLWGDLRDIPVLVVGYDALNDQLQNSNHNGSSQIMTRGLCLSEHQSGRRIELQKMRFDKHNRSFAPSDPESKGFTYFQVPDGSKVNPDASVTAILCLSGLPSDLTASVMAHEATHAWIKLHPNYNIANPIPMQVEEGVCQLVSHLFLCDGLEAASTLADNSGPSDEKLRQYFKFCIETDENEIYGTGYRLAAKAYASIGIEALLSHIVMYREFPEV